MDEQLIPLVAGYLLDLLLGDPRWLPHPIRLFGTIIAKGEQLLNKGRYKLLKGALLSVTLCAAVYLFFYMLEYYIPGYYLFSGIFVFYGLANKSLLEEGIAVFNELQIHGLAAGRKRLSWIVGRDTSQLDENQIRTAVFETLSENLSDGVIAPLFYYAIGGVPAMMVYKMINTLDSMIGYKKERYLLFGRFAARLDDVANFIPARLTALLMVLVTFSKQGLLYIFKYGHQHASPNSGYPEAALAGIMQCRFGGPNTYDGTVVHKPYIGNEARLIHHHELRKVMYVNHAVTLVMVAGIILIRLFIKI
ncbi:adenosylcobinamide-phosphate synthase [Chitinophaga sp. CF118]|uniref:adenosylcobinamide-phosphate synthase CbiB n=1 Tax=Chitinophaga sp. CF118 TaxID=1884367 RepID=UPI0008E4DD4B|nr:adenosylcobinamide-phosphate synthase CbiB [Chitinophaga sp. CF118]SFD48074.1 adenosylcobinamide-phosphate synthase [Chitinophaga sp. CF118]